MSRLETILSGDYKPYINEIILDVPELLLLKGSEGHKDNFIHTFKVLDKCYLKSDKIEFRLVGLLHDLGKAYTKKIEDGKVSFHGHEEKSYRMLPNIWKRLGIKSDINYVGTLVRYHGMVDDICPSSRYDKGITDSAIRRFYNLLGDYVYDMLDFTRCDITTSDINKEIRIIKSVDRLEQQIRELKQKDIDSKWKCPISGNFIMGYYNIQPSKELGVIKKDIESAIKNGLIEDNFDSAFKYMTEKYIK